VVNLVFFKLVRSKTKFWQMVGRGTRLCPDLFGPGRDKECFYLFDYCQNLEYFGQDPAASEGVVGASLGKRLFLARLEMVAELDGLATGETLAVPAEAVVERGEPFGDPTTPAELRRSVAGVLHGEVAAMNVDNFVVRTRRRQVERWARPEAWSAPLSAEARQELAAEVAGLPSEAAADEEMAKRFDLLILELQLALLRSEPSFVRLRDQLRSIAGLLAEKSTIPMVWAQRELIDDLLSDEWWQDVTVVMLEPVRRRLRDLVRLIERRERRPLYTDFEDEMGAEVPIELPGFASGEDFERFRAKARAFLRAHEDHIAIHKLRRNQPLTPADLAELERMLAESGVGGPEEIARAKHDSAGLGLFVRSLVGLDRQAAKEALAGFLTGKTLGANQIEFLDLMIEHLTEHGVMDAALLYESPFTDVTPQGPDGIFTTEQVDELLGVLEKIRATALVA
jgi:type I restriction enzyme R subunit